MIPIRLKLHNFLPYQDPDPIYFDGIHLACLTGENGAGKSSLLDAITWAIWGKARAKRADDLVHQGREEMSVTLDFEHEGNHYRVERRHTTGKRGSSGSGLNMFLVGADNSLQTIKEPSIRQMQDRINEILRLDYDTFVNSAFLQQGEADAFTTKTPAERKKILRKILGLDQWEVYEARAKEAVNRVQDDIRGIEGELRQIDVELQHEAQYRKAEADAKRDLELAQENLSEAEKRFEAVQNVPVELRNQLELQETAQRNIQQVQEELSEIDTQLQQSQEAVQKFERTIAQADRIEAGHAALREARSRSQELNTALREINRIKRLEEPLTQQLQQAQAALKHEEAVLQGTIRDAQQALATDYDEEYARLQSRIAELEAQQAERETLLKRFSDLRAEQGKLKAEQAALKVEGTEINERIEALEAVEGATCPLCGQPLDEDHRERLLAEIIENRDVMRGKYKAANERIFEIDQTVQQNKTRIDEIAESVAELPRCQDQLGRIEAQREHQQEARTRSEEAQQQLKIVQTRLRKEDYGHEIREALAKLQAQRQDITYDEGQHESVDQNIEQYQRFDDEYQRLQSARDSLEREQEYLTGLEKRHQRLTERLEDENDELLDIQERIEVLKARHQEYERLNAEVVSLRTKLQDAHQKLGIAQQQMRALEASRTRKEEKLAEEEECRSELALLKQLQAAFGKDGVPAMIIEAAVPELEVTASELLSRMTNGRMHLRISTQKEKVTGGQKETLDIDIADELGTRPYEMYSGGEAFRINFALRVALSKLLARRAGSHLRTLFIDEGFGTQDDLGRSRLIEAINVIKEDFDLILVITHIEELRDAFPVHVVVRKTPNGSAVLVQ